MSLSMDKMRHRPCSKACRTLSINTVRGRLYMKHWKTLLCFVAVIAAGNVQAQDIESLDVELQSVESNSRGTKRSRQVVEVEQQQVATPNGGVWIVNSQGGSQASNTNASNQESQLVNQPT